ncbi:helix-turn-helix domain-containing protein [Runella sp.]|uniref:helix-turn-helix domain-containing protein n=1 Tax=Runella sp. TaxID=1960881 RepID=UPI00301A2198
MSFEDSLYEVVRRAVSNELQKQIFELRESITATPSQPTDGKLYLSAKEAADFMGIKLQTLYQNIERVPHVKKHGKLLFTRDGLISYVEQK